MSDMPENNDENTAEVAPAVDAAPAVEAEPAVEPEPAADAAPDAPVPPEAPVPPAPAADEPAPEKVPFSAKTVGLPAFIACVVAAVVIGFACGHFLLNNTSSVALNGTTTLTSDQLDSAIASYTYNGSTYDVTAREVFSQSGSVEKQADSDGNYSVPTATDVLSYVRNQVVLKAAADQGITVSDEDVDAYAQSVFGSTDYATLASQYNMDEDALKSTVSDSAIMSKLRDSISSVELPDSPTAPTAPSSDAQDTPTAEYASYIISLAGDEWDRDNNTWASTDGDYYSALSTYEISNDSATYAAAQVAYNVAQSKYTAAITQARSDFNTYCNELLSRSTLQLGSLMI